MNNMGCWTERNDKRVWLLIIYREKALNVFVTPRWTSHLVAEVFHGDRAEWGKMFSELLFVNRKGGRQTFDLALCIGVASAQITSLTSGGSAPATARSMAFPCRIAMFRAWPCNIYQNQRPTKWSNQDCNGNKKAKTSLTTKCKFNLP